jgi:hypothetical protein
MDASKVSMFLVKGTFFVGLESLSDLKVWKMRSGSGISSLNCLSSIALGQPVGQL